MKLAKVFAFYAAMHLASAAPLDGANNPQKRDLVVQTQIVNVVETVTSTTTITLKPGEPSPAPKQEPDAQQQQRPPVAPAVVTSTSSAEPKPSPAPAAAPIVAHQNPNSNPKPNPPAPKAPQPQPAPQPAPQPKVVTPQTPAAGSSSSGSNSGSGSGSGSSKFPVITIPGASVPDGPGPFTATATHYTTGLGACGWTSTDDELVMAVSHLMMGDQSNGNPLCGRFATITGPSKTPVRAKVVDKCANCHDSSPTGPFNIDLSPALFEAVGNGDGIMNVVWDWA